MAEEQVAEPVGQEVAHSDGSDLPGPEQLLHGPPASVVVPVGHVDQVQVQVVRPQVLQGLVKGAHGLVVSRVLDPDLGGEEQLLPGDPALPDGLADRPLVAVAGRRVDQAVSGL